MSYGIEEVKAWLDDLCNILGLQNPHRLQSQYEEGLFPTLLSYSKVNQPRGEALPAIEKYQISAQSYINFPVNFYEIFRAGRSVPFLNLLSQALRFLTDNKISGLASKIALLKREKDYDTFESMAFELITAWRYCTSGEIKLLKFIPETPRQKTPDFFIIRNDGSETYCECKKLNRMSDDSVELRNQARELLNPAILEFRKNGISTVAEVQFFDDLKKFTPRRILKAWQMSLEDGATIIREGFSINAKYLPTYETSSPELFPSPKFLWNRYGFRERDEWYGLVNQSYFSRVHYTDKGEITRGAESTWIQGIEWDCAAKWKVSDEVLHQQKRRFQFKRVFEGLEQLKDKGINTTLHLCIETEHCIGDREKPILDLVERLRKNNRDSFGWLIINELYFDVSPKGYFDMIEHAHKINGPVATFDDPIVTNVFTSEFDSNGTTRIGGVLPPDIDKVNS